MTTPTKHLEIFDEKFGYAHKDDLKQHLIQTVIDVLEEEIKKIEVIRKSSEEYNNMFPGRDEYYYDACTADVLKQLTTTLSTWRAMLETTP